MSAAGWTTIRVRTRFPDPVSAVLFSRGADAVQETNDGIVTHLRNADTGALERAVGAVDATATVEFSVTPDVDWSAAWRDQIMAHRVGRLVVTPPWLAEGFAESERIVIEPAMAFGTGEHESTRGALRLLQAVVRPEDVVVDAGAGSGVLAIAATRLGAGRVVAIEMDPDAIGNAETNVAANGVEARVSILVGDALLLLPLVAPARVVVANIISSVIEALLPIVATSTTPDGEAVLAGILVDESDRMRHSIRAIGWRITAEETEGAWWSVAIARR